VLRDDFSERINRVIRGFAVQIYMFRANRLERNQFGGGVMLLVKSNACHGQFVLPSFVNLETISFCLYFQNHPRLLFVSLYKPPDSPILHSDLESVSSQSVI
jgi:hypothetical protein